MPECERPILVVTCGDPDVGINLFGHFVAEVLADQPVDGVEVVELCGDPSALHAALLGRNTLYIVDGVRCPEAPLGNVLDLDWFDPTRPPLQSERLLASMERSLHAQIEAAVGAGTVPSIVRLIGVTIGALPLGWSVEQLLRDRAVVAAQIIRRRAQRLCATALPERRRRDRDAPIRPDPPARRAHRRRSSSGADS